ncbi:carboxypeptidase-like regulatory domain-containing protein [Tuwongella immobilis]|uniref:Carboxypeptidase regulatory-like domain-containing protein n=1 Tax=Tuwongella immobilis TaxID=692036 RepID=A0A6C2YSY4_9BACT|nr:carboxypeptidase-like regulatory domain-containing protein [Tuwongella immobilis]VIP04159.1 Uncharacterized protein OS=Acetohalobium arabaticum (strain ATCC 49924 / DSM 5501 / Z-7288) GN=Acear_0778 PE=4 SV=1 [Tuwongella immobilis]VTS05683.1 Uncharacterized protein OS=Acetohalobium arabaticum (strain ATCC 49924 / DSM 5501 / Z-7288) GN=Acear_0778 PE=4 SV=1 [Tuwongella immobilis]
MQSKPTAGWAIVAMVLLLPGLAWAHAMVMELFVEATEVRVEAYYDDETPAELAKVSVFNESDRIIAEGRCDERGVFRFPKPSPGLYRVQADAAGHRATKTLTLEDPNAIGNPGTAAPAKKVPLLQIPATLIGLVVIAGMTVLIWLVTRNRSESSPPSHS